MLTTKILVVDDTPEHLEAAKALAPFDEIDVITKSGYADGLEYLRQNEVQILLTDFLLPTDIGALGGCCKGYEFQLEPFGLMLLFEAAKRGVKFGAAITDTGPALQHPMVFAFSRFSWKGESRVFDLNGMRALVSDGYGFSDDNRRRDWRLVMRALIPREWPYLHLIP